MEFYTVDELTEIVLRSAQVFHVSIDREGAREIARRSRGTPRLANRLLKRVRDFAEVKYRRKHYTFGGKFCIGFAGSR